MGACSCCLSVELNNIIRNKEDLLTDVKNLCDNSADSADTDAQFVECLQQIKDMSEEKEQRRKQLEDLEEAA